VLILDERISTSFFVGADRPSSASFSYASMEAAEVAQPSAMLDLKPPTHRPELGTAAPERTCHRVSDKQ
jgi:hypothetical protein